MDAQKLLTIAVDYIEAGRDLDRATVAGVEVEDRRPAVADEWAAALTEFIDARLAARVGA